MGRPAAAALARAHPLHAVPDAAARPLAAQAASAPAAHAVAAPAEADLATAPRVARAARSAEPSSSHSRRRRAVRPRRIVSGPEIRLLLTILLVRDGVKRPALARALSVKSLLLVDVVVVLEVCVAGHRQALALALARALARFTVRQKLCIQARECDTELAVTPGVAQGFERLLSGNIR